MLTATWTAVVLVGALQGVGAQAPAGLTVVVADVGQGDGVVIQAPDGVVHCIDAGPSGQGAATILPLISSLQPTGYGYVVCSHYHSDHLGGLDTVLNALPFQVALDRGNVSVGGTSSFNSYVAAAGARRQSVAVGGVYALGGGATMTCIAANGSVAGGACHERRRREFDRHAIRDHIGGRISCVYVYVDNTSRSGRLSRTLPCLPSKHGPAATRHLLHDVLVVLQFPTRIVVRKQ